MFVSDGFNLRSTEINIYLGVIMLNKINQWIKIRNKNYNNFTQILNKYKKTLNIANNKNISSFVLPFLMKNKKLKNST